MAGYYGVIILSDKTKTKFTFVDNVYFCHNPIFFTKLNFVRQKSLMSTNGFWSATKFESVHETDIYRILSERNHFCRWNKAGPTCYSIQVNIRLTYISIRVVL